MDNRLLPKQSSDTRTLLKPASKHLTLMLLISPDLFSLYSEIILKNIRDMPGIKIGGHNVNNLRYADDIVLIAENESDLQNLLNVIEEERRRKGFELNTKKTQVMVISRQPEPVSCNIFINGLKLKQREQFKYLGNLISSHGRNNTEIITRIAQAKLNFQKMKTILTNKNMSVETRKRVLKCYIEPILLYIWV